MLFSLSQDGQAPKFLGHIHSRSQLPLRALYTTFIFIAAVTIYANFNPKSVMGLLNIIGASLHLFGPQVLLLKSDYDVLLKSKIKISINCYLIRRHFTLLDLLSLSQRCYS